MLSRRRRTLLALVLAMTAALTLPVVQAGLAEAAGTPALSISPATGVKDGQQVSVTLTGAGDYDGMTVGFAECLANDDYYSGGCTAINPQATISGGNASGTVTALVGPMPNNPGLSCTVANNGTCAIRAFVFMNGGTNMIAVTPISFATAAATVTATPSSNLKDGDQVAVSVTDIPRSAGSRIDISECNTDAAESQGSYFTGACKLLGTGTSSQGSFAKTVTILDGMITSSVSCNETTPSGHCVLAALDHDNQKLLGTTPITFAAQTLTVTVNPSTGLHQGQQVPVTVTGIPTGVSSLLVLECNTAYTNAHGFDSQLTGCERGPDLQVKNNALSTTLTVRDGLLNDEAGNQTCNYDNNGECGIVLIKRSEDYSSFSQVGSAVPISFRVPITGLTTIDVSPTTGLHNELPLTVSVPDVTIPDGVDTVQFLECNLADLEAKNGNTDATCYFPGRADVTFNSIPTQQVAIKEGPVGEFGKSRCDPTHDCALALFSYVPFGGEITRLSDWVPLSFRDPNALGAPVMKVSPITGLKHGQKVKVTLEKVPDLVRYLDILECNVSIPKKQWVDGEMPCVNLSGVYPPMIHFNTGSKSMKVKAVMVGYQKVKGGGTKKVYCNASTNGQCALVAYHFDYKEGAPIGVMARSARISFAP